MSEHEDQAADSTMRGLVARWLVLASAKLTDEEQPISDVIDLWIRDLVENEELNDQPGLEAGIRNTLVAGAATMVAMLHHLAALEGTEDPTDMLKRVAESMGFTARFDT